MSSKEMSATHEESSGSTRQLVDVPDIPWYRQTELRKLYVVMPFLFLGSTTLGYDGSVLNGLQTMNTWQECKQCTTESPTTTNKYSFRSSCRI